MSNKLIIGSRGSDLALWQANFVMHELQRIGIHADIRIIKTQGDIVQNLSWDKMEGKGFFTKEIEDALLNNEIDLAVHSHKDLPTESVNGLVIAAVSDREDPSELLLMNKAGMDEKQKFSLKHGALVGTSSARRKSQMLAWRPDVQLQDLRGNVPTRIQKLRDKKYDAILIANAGVSRLEIDLSEFHVEVLDPKEFIPAPAQGVLALQIRQSDKILFKKLQKLNRKKIAETISVERKVLNLFDGGCQLPLGVFCEKQGSLFKVHVAKADKWDSTPRFFYFESKTTKGFAENIVRKMNAPLSLERGARGEVFIARDEKPSDFFKRTLEAHGYTVHCKSMIEIKPVAFRNVPKTDWIFFSSRNAVRHFFEQYPEVNGAKLGAISKGTADELLKFGKRAEFIGTSDNTQATAKKFAALAGKGKVLFPQAKGSLRTVQQQLNRNQVNEITVYETFKSSKAQIPDAGLDILIFTSPSNAEAFLEKNKITAQQKVIAMGEATAKFLKKHKVKTSKQPVSFDDLGLVQSVFGI